MSQSLQAGAPKFKIRQANLSDVDSLTELHMEAFTPEDNIPVLLGRRYVRATYRWLVKSKVTFTLVAVAQDRIIGLVAVADISFTKPMFRACIRQFLLCLVRKPSLLFRQRLWLRLIRGDKNSSPMARCIVKDKRIAQLTIVVVDREFRGQGVFPVLIDAAKELSRSRGSRAIRAGVYKANRQSRRAFEKVGWVEMPELETNNLVFYADFLDANIATEIGVSIEKYK